MEKTKMTLTEETMTRLRESEEKLEANATAAGKRDGEMWAMQSASMRDLQLLSTWNDRWEDVDADDISRSRLEGLGVEFGFDADRWLDADADSYIVGFVASALDVLNAYYRQRSEERRSPTEPTAPTVSPFIRG
jgi:hypothetical protein